MPWPVQGQEAPAHHWHYQWDEALKAQGVLYIPAGRQAPDHGSTASRGVLSLCIRGVAIVNNLHDLFHW